MILYFPASKLKKVSEYDQEIQMQALDLVYKLKKMLESLVLVINIKR